MQISSSLSIWERLWRRALETASELTDGMIWQGMLRAQRQPEDVRRHAEILSMLKGIDRLFFHELSQYPEWAQDVELRGRICSWVSSIRRINTDTVSLKMRGSTYRFHFTSRPCASADGEKLHHHGTLQLFINGRQVLGLKLVQDDEALDVDWHEVDIDTFVNGNWVADLKSLSQQILSENRVREPHPSDATAQLVR